MATCLECEVKIGWLKKPVEGVYCSEACREASLRAASERERRGTAARIAEALAEERTRLEREAAAALRASNPVSEVVLKAPAGQLPCPKCSAPWAAVQGGGRFGRHRGDCARCGFSAEFIAVEACPNCRCASLVVESEDDARCPRCKSRPRRRRQIA